MTVELPENPVRSSAPLARISREALRANLAAIGAARGFSAALQADGRGHGAVFVRDVLGAATDAAPREGADAEGTGSLADIERLFGLAPGFTPVMTLVGRVLSVKRLRAGEGVSYGYTHRAPRDTTVALVTGGYAQGIVRALGNHAAVLVGDERRPIVGRVAMDSCHVDVGPTRVGRGDEVEFFGPRLPVGEWA